MRLQLRDRSVGLHGGLRCPAAAAPAAALPPQCHTGRRPQCRRPWLAHDPVFSERALEFLREDDPATYALITPKMEAWRDITLVHRGERIRIDGIGFNGVSQGAAYGDDVQGATNYPLVRIRNLRTSHVFYSRTHDHSSMAVASDAVVSTHFNVSRVQESGPSVLEVVANGIASRPIFVWID